MPCYNPGPEISDTLNSLKAQQVPFKLFVVDDGSKVKPDYQALLRDFDHHLILLPHNIGVNEVRNPALGQILKENFKFVALIDCGDVARPERLLRQRETMAARADIDILGTAIHQVFTVTSTEFILRLPETAESVQRVMWSKLPFSHPTLMIRSEVFRKIGFYSNRFHAAEDYELIRRALKAGFKAANLPDVLLDKIETSESVSHKKRTQQLNSRLAIQWHYRDLTNPHCILGMVRTLIIRILPQKWLDRIKKPLIGDRQTIPLQHVNGEG